MAQDKNLAVIGHSIGPYQILTKLGTGGIVEVYRIRDTKFGPEVAIRVVLDSLFGDAERAARFEARRKSSTDGIIHPDLKPALRLCADAVQLPLSASLLGDL